MRALHTIKDACADALERDTPDSTARFHAVVDPGSVMEMAALIESFIDYVEKLDDLTAQELVREAKHRTAGSGPEGAV